MYCNPWTVMIVAGGLVLLLLVTRQIYPSPCTLAMVQPLYCSCDEWKSRLHHGVTSKCTEISTTPLLFNPCCCNDLQQQRMSAELLA